MALEQKVDGIAADLSEHRRDTEAHRKGGGWGRSEQPACKFVNKLTECPRRVSWRKERNR